MLLAIKALKEIAKIGKIFFMFNPHRNLIFNITTVRIKCRETVKKMNISLNKTKRLRILCDKFRARQSFHLESDGPIMRAFYPCNAVLIKFEVL